MNAKDVLRKPLGLMKERYPGAWGRGTRRWMRFTRRLAPLEIPRDRVRSTMTARRQRQRFDEVERYLMFVGASRSGHSLVGSLLNAHPDVVVGHQVDALRYLAAGFSRDQLFALLLDGEERYGKKGRVSNKGRYDYNVPGGWQGRVRLLRVIGDKRGHTSTNALGADPGLLDRLVEVVGVPVVLVHVQRNPFDNVATFAKRTRRTLADAAGRYFDVIDTVDRLREHPAVTLVEVRHEDLVSDAPAVLRTLCEALSIQVQPSYLDACSSIVYASPHRSRFEADWSPDDRALVEAGIAARPRLAGYAFDDPA